MSTPDLTTVTKVRDQVVDRILDLLNDDTVNILVNKATCLVLGYEEYEVSDEDELYWSTYSTVIAQALSLASVRQTFLRPPVK